MFVLNILKQTSTNGMYNAKASTIRTEIKFPVSQTYQKRCHCSRILPKLIHHPKNTLQCFAAPVFSIGKNMRNVAKHTNT